MAYPDIQYPRWPDPSRPDTLPKPLEGEGLPSIGSGPIEVRSCYQWRGTVPEIQYPPYPNGKRPAAILPPRDTAVRERHQPELMLSYISLGN